MSEELNMMEEEVEVKEEAQVKPDELLPVFLSWVEDGVEEDEMIMKLHKEHNLALSSAVGRYRKLKGQAGLTSPRGHKAEDVQAFIQAKVDEDMSRGDIIDAMVEKFGYTKKSAQSTFSTQGKKLGITGEGGMSARVPISSIVKFLRDNQDLKKQELISKMAEELNYAESTCGAFYTYIPMAQEWAKQEMDAS